MKTQVLARALAGSKQRKARVEIIPLIDVIFFLLATFVLFTLSLNRILVIPVELPQTTPGGPEPTEMVMLRIADPLTLYWDQDAITWAELPAKLAQHKAAEARPRVMITADAGVQFGDATAVLDEIRAAKGVEVTFDMRLARRVDAEP